ncbi:hypothetical protein B0H14DRAFT_3146734 [Mycena olivaceomarginata]|nr:hypothetical protein B0H14DRAFT_3146734 [Mycena olivaceomarginata]
MSQKCAKFKTSLMNISVSPTPLAKIAMSSIRQDADEYANIVQAECASHFSILADAKPAKWLAKPTKWLASHSAGRGRVMPAKSTPPPETSHLARAQAIWPSQKRHSHDSNELDYNQVFRHPLLLRIFASIIRGSASADGVMERSSRRPKANTMQRIFGIVSASPGAIVASTIWAIWLCSGDDTFAPVGDVTGINYYDRYNEYLEKIFEGLRRRQKWARDLFVFWDSHLFPETNGSQFGGGVRPDDEAARVEMEGATDLLMEMPVVSDEEDADADLRSCARVTTHLTIGDAAASNFRRWAPCGRRTRASAVSVLWSGIPTLGGLGSGFPRVLLGWGEMRKTMGDRRAREWNTWWIWMGIDVNESDTPAYLRRMLPLRPVQRRRVHTRSTIRTRMITYAPQPLPIVHGGYLPYQLPGTMLSAPMAPPSGGPVGGGDGGGSVIQVAHTDDAATKLSDWVRRRCFNCCTADTSTWSCAKNAASLSAPTHALALSSSAQAQPSRVLRSSLALPAPGSADTPKSPTLPTPRRAVLFPFHHRTIFPPRLQPTVPTVPPPRPPPPPPSTAHNKTALIRGRQILSKTPPRPDSAHTPGVDSIHPPSRDERRERQKERREERRGGTPE